jgi:hypothetical protein
MSIDVMKQALEALERCAEKIDGEWGRCRNLAKMEEQNCLPEIVRAPIFALRQAIEQAEKQEPVADTLIRKYVAALVANVPDAAAEVTKAMVDYCYTAPPQRQPLTDSVREMRDVQGMDGNWNYDPYMHGLYNGLEFAVSLLEQREPQFKDAPKQWLCDLPKLRIFSANHGITGEKE